MDNDALLGIGRAHGGYDLPELAGLADRTEAQTDALLSAAAGDTIAQLAGLCATARTARAALSPTGKRRLARVSKITTRQMTQRKIDKPKRYQPGKTYVASTYPRAQARKASGSYAKTWQPPGPRWNKPADMLAVGLSGTQDDAPGAYTLSGTAASTAADEALQGLGSWLSRAVRTVAPVVARVAPLALGLIPGVGPVAAGLATTIGAGLFNGIPGQSAAVTQAMTAQQQAAATAAAGARPQYPIPQTPEEFAAYVGRMLNRNQNTIRALTAPDAAPAPGAPASNPNANPGIPWLDMGVPGAPAGNDAPAGQRPSPGLDKNTLLILGGLAVLLIASRK